jgi:hypothetical protein
MSYIAPIEKHVQHMSKAKMLNTQFISIVCMVVQFQLNNEI